MVYLQINAIHFNNSFHFNKCGNLYRELRCSKIVNSKFSKFSKF